MKPEKLSRKQIAEYKFRPLKKQLRKQIKLIGQAVDSEQLPSKNSLEEFLDLVRVMISYPGFGDDYYEEFLATCLDLQNAFKRKDKELFKKTYARVIFLRNRCHKKYCL